MREVRVVFPHLFILLLQLSTIYAPTSGPSGSLPDAGNGTPSRLKNIVKEKVVPQSGKNWAHTLLNKVRETREKSNFLKNVKSDRFKVPPAFKGVVWNEDDRDFWTPTKTKMQKISKIANKTAHVIGSTLNPFEKWTGKWIHTAKDKIDDFWEKRIDKEQRAKVLEEIEKNKMRWFGSKVDAMQEIMLYVQLKFEQLHYEREKQIEAVIEKLPAKLKGLYDTEISKLDKFIQSKLQNPKIDVKDHYDVLIELGVKPTKNRADFKQSDLDSELKKLKPDVVKNLDKRILEIESLLKRKAAPELRKITAQDKYSVLNKIDELHKGEFAKVKVGKGTLKDEFKNINTNYYYEDLMNTRANIPKHGCEISFNLKDEVLNNTFLFEQGVLTEDGTSEKWEDPFLFKKNDANDDYNAPDDDDDDESPDETPTVIAIRAIQDGEKAFGKKTDDKNKKWWLDWSKMTEYSPENPPKPNSVKQAWYKIVDETSGLINRIKSAKYYKAVQEAIKKRQTPPPKPPGVKDIDEYPEDENEPNCDEDPSDEALKYPNFVEIVKKMSDKESDEFLKEAEDTNKKILDRLSAAESGDPFNDDIGDKDAAERAEKWRKLNEENRGVMNSLKKIAWKYTPKNRALYKKMRDPAMKKLQDEVSQAAAAKNDGDEGESNLDAEAINAPLEKIRQMKVHPWEFLSDSEEVGGDLRYWPKARPGRFTSVRLFRRLTDVEYEMLKRELGLPNEYKAMFEELKEYINKKGFFNKMAFWVNWEKRREKSFARAVATVLSDLKGYVDHKDDEVKIAYEKAQLQKGIDEIKICSHLASLTEIAIYDVRDNASNDLRGRMAAQIINAVLNQKDMAGVKLALSLSLIGTSIIAITFDAFIWPHVIAAVGPFLGPVGAHILTIFLYSLTPLLAETFDSMVIKRMIAVQRGGKFFPKKGKRMETFLSALQAGTIAAFGSVWNNSMELATWQFFPMMIMSNMVATTTSAAMVPFEVKSSEEATYDNLLNKLMNGFLAMPDLKEFLTWRRLQTQNKWWKKLLRNLGKFLGFGNWDTKTPAEMEKDVHDNWDKMPKKAKRALLQQYIIYKIDRIMDFTSITGMNKNSLATGVIVSICVGFVPFYALNQVGVLSTEFVKIILVVLNAPTEILSMSLDKLISSKGGLDARKHRNMIGLLMKHAIHRLLEWLGDRKKKAAMKPVDIMESITDDEIHDIYYFNFMMKFVNGFGKRIVRTFMCVGKWGKSLIGGITTGFKKLFKLPVFRKIGGFSRKMKDEGNMVMQYMNEQLAVPNYQENVVYIVIHPRTSTSPSLSPMSLKLETWCKMRKLIFYRLTNPFIGVAPFTDKFPYVEVNGNIFRGSVDDIIRNLERKDFLVSETNVFMDLSKNKNDLKEERHIRRLFDEVIYRCLIHEFDKMFEYEKTDKGKKTHTIKPNFMKNDLGLYRQMMPTIPRYYPRLFNKSYGVGPLKQVIPLPFSREFWDKYFEEEKIGIQNGNVKYDPKKDYCTIKDPAFGKSLLNKIYGGNDRKWDKYMTKLGEEIIPRVRNKMMKRVKRKAMFTLRKTYYRYYNKEDDKWYLIKYDMKKLELDAAGRTKRDQDVKDQNAKMRHYRYLPIKYKHFEHKPDVVLNSWNGNRDDLWRRIVNGRSEIYDFDKILFDALKVAVEQLKKSKKSVQTKVPNAKFYLFGNKPTPADASVFAELAIFYEVHNELTNKKLKDFFEKAKTKTDPNHVLWEFVQQVKEHDFMRKEDDSIHNGGRSLTLNSSSWESLKSEPWPLNWDWDLEAKSLPAKYEGPFQLKHKEFPLLEDEEFIKNDNIDQQEEAEDEEQKDMDDKDLEIKDGKLLGDGNQANSNGDDKEEEENNWIKGYADEFTKEEIDNFVPLTALEAWKNLNDNRVLYDAPEEPGNIFHHYSKMYRYLAQKFLMLTGLKQNEKLIDVQIPADYDLEDLEDSLVVNINKIIFGDNGGNNPAQAQKPGQGNKAAVAAKQVAQAVGNVAKKIDDKLLGIADWMKETNSDLKKKGPPVGRTLLHLMAAHACEGQVSEEQAVEVCKEQEGGGVRQSILKWAGRKFEKRSWDKYKNMGKKLSGAADDRLTMEQENSITVQLCLKEVKANSVEIKTKEVKETKETTEMKEEGERVLACGDMHRALAYGLLGEVLHKKSMPDKSKVQERENFLKDLKKVVEEQLKVEPKKADPNRDNTLGEDVKAIIEKMTENYKRIVVDPDYSPEDVKAFEPIGHISKPKLVHVDEKNEVFKIDEIVMFYYPEVMQYLVLELPKLADLTLAKELRLTQRPDRFYIQNSGWWRRHFGGKKFKKIDAKRERVDGDPKLDALKTEIKKEFKKAEAKTKKKEPIVMAMLHQMAAYLCENKDENKDTCGDKHRKAAAQHLTGVAADVVRQLNELVKSFTFQMIMNYNEDIAEEELDKQGTKISGELEALPKGPGLWQKIKMMWSKLFGVVDKTVKFLLRVFTDSKMNNTITMMDKNLKADPETKDVSMKEKIGEGESWFNTKYDNVDERCKDHDSGLPEVGDGDSMEYNNKEEL